MRKNRRVAETRNMIKNHKTLRTTSAVKFAERNDKIRRKRGEHDDDEMETFLRKAPEKYLH